MSIDNSERQALKLENNSIVKDFVLQKWLV